MTDWIGDSGLYFYSAVFQGNMALLALTGVFAVFRVQQLSNRLDMLRSIIVQLTNAAYGRSDVPLLWVQADDIEGIDNKVSELREKCSRGEILEGRTEFGILKTLERNVSPRIENYHETRQKLEAVKVEMARPLRLTAAVAALSLVLLILTRPMASISDLALLATMLVTAYLSIRALIANVRFVFTVFDACLRMPRWIAPFFR